MSMPYILRIQRKNPEKILYIRKHADLLGKVFDIFQNISEILCEDSDDTDRILESLCKTM